VLSSQNNLSIDDTLPFSFVSFEFEDLILAILAYLIGGSIYG
jgi:hypothetical protein